MLRGGGNVAVNDTGLNKMMLTMKTNIIVLDLWLNTENLSLENSALFFFNLCLINISN